MLRRRGWHFDKVACKRRYPYEKLVPVVLIFVFAAANVNYFLGGLFIISLSRTHGNAFLRFCIVYCSQGNREQPAHYLKQYKNAGKRFRVYGALAITYYFKITF